MLMKRLSVAQWQRVSIRNSPETAATDIIFSFVVTLQLHLIIGKTNTADHAST